MEARTPHRTDLLRGLGALVVLAIAAYIGSRSLSNPAASPEPSAATGVVVGTPGGAVLADPSPSPSPQPTMSPAPTTQPTPQPTVATTPDPAPTQTFAPVPPQPTPAVVAHAGPADAVAAFYGSATDGSFDTAYALWSERMRATYPRSGNLDQRFDSTAGITFQQLHVAEMSGGSATVQANFTETYDTGASRQFVGYWRLVQVENRWLLDEPNY